jgi:hypothetical protein
MELDNMAVDPEHFRRGYGTKLCQYGMAIAKEDSVPVGIIAAAMGAKLYSGLGFKTVVKRDRDRRAPGFACHSPLLGPNLAHIWCCGVESSCSSLLYHMRIIQPYIDIN